MEQSWSAVVHVPDACDTCSLHDRMDYREGRLRTVDDDS